MAKKKPTSKSPPPAKSSTGLPAGYAELLDDLKDRIRSAQVKAALSVNRELTALYWHIGRTLVERQQTEKWGSKAIDRLATDLQHEFPGETGFSRQNVYRMRAFFLAYSDQRAIVSQAARQLPDTPPEPLAYLSPLDSPTTGVDRRGSGLPAPMSTLWPPPACIRPAGCTQFSLTSTGGRTPMNEHQMRQILDWFRNRVGTITCSVCGSTDQKFDSELTALPVWRSEPHPHLDFSDDVVAVMMVCTHCASIRLFSAAKMGICRASTQRAPLSDYPVHGAE